MCVTLPSRWLERDSLFNRRAPDKDEGVSEVHSNRLRMTHPNRTTTGKEVDEAEILWCEQDNVTYTTQTPLRKAADLTNGLRVISTQTGTRSCCGFQSGPHFGPSGWEKSHWPAAWKSSLMSDERTLILECSEIKSLWDQGGRGEGGVVGKQWFLILFLKMNHVECNCVWCPWLCGEKWRLIFRPWPPVLSCSSSYSASPVGAVWFMHLQGKRRAWGGG